MLVILETHLGWAARGMGVKLTKMIEEGREAEKFDNTSCKCSETPQICLMLKDASYDQLKIMGHKYKGVTLATPVFDGASEAEIKEYLRLADLDDDGQTVLFDGRTGGAFDNSDRRCNVCSRHTTWWTKLYSIHWSILTCDTTTTGW